VARSDELQDSELLRELGRGDRASTPASMAVVRWEVGMARDACSATSEDPEPVLNLLFMLPGLLIFSGHLRTICQCV
jgi:hypothetical protein